MSNITKPIDINDPGGKLTGVGSARRSPGCWARGRKHSAPRATAGSTFRISIRQRDACESVQGWLSQSMTAAHTAPTSPTLSMTRCGSMSGSHGRHRTCCQGGTPCPGHLRGPALNPSTMLDRVAADDLDEAQRHSAVPSNGRPPLPRRRDVVHRVCHHRTSGT